MIDCKWSAEGFSAAEWDLLHNTQGAMPCLDSRNVLLLLKHFGTGRERTMVCRDHGDVVAMTVLTGRSIARTFSPSNQPIALWVQRPEYCFTELLRTLAAGRLMVSALQVDPDIHAWPVESGELVERVDYIQTGCVTIDTPFEAYWKERGNLRENLRKQRNRLGKAGIATRLEVIADPLEIGAAVDDFGRMESLGWKSANGTAVHPDNAQGRYYRELFERYAATGHASAWRYFYGDRLVATDLCVHLGETFIVLKTTYDEAERATSPSKLMRREMFERLFTERRYTSIEFYGRAMGWHHDWTDEFRTMYHANAFRAPWVRTIRGACRRLKARGSRVAGIYPASDLPPTA